MDFLEIKQLIIQKFGDEVILQSQDQAPQPALTIALESMVEVCRFLRDDPRLYFDYLACLTGIDNAPTQETMEVVYHLNALVYQHTLVLRVFAPRHHPHVPTVSHLWRTADWHERETYDLLGIVFDGHPDLRRILLPQDWEGFPLRKDYQTQQTYHGIEVKY